jgi:hypothetical protein
MAIFHDVFAGYKTWHSLQNGGWTNEYRLLENIARKGLIFISTLTEMELNGDECLLLS